MSGYDPELVQGVLNQAGALQRRLESRAQPTAMNDADEGDKMGGSLRNIL